jgi:hypothetical protein
MNLRSNPLPAFAFTFIFAIVAIVVPPADGTERNAAGQAVEGSDPYTTVGVSGTIAFNF